MITHSIKAPGFIQSVINRVLPLTRPPIVQVQTRGLPPPEDKVREYWDKIVFTKWIENVKLGFKKSDLVTFSANSPKAGIMPLWWKIAYIEEIYTLAEYDQILEEPRVLCLHGQSGGFLNKCPRVMRVLTKEEMELVDLSNKIPQGNC